VPDIKYSPHNGLQPLLETFFGRITMFHKKKKKNNNNNNNNNNKVRHCSAPSAEGNFVSEIGPPKH
jgi:hypothetical protein